MSKLTGYLLLANGGARVIEVENELHALQAVVGGNIEVVRFATDAIILANEDGINLGLPPNRHLKSLVGDLLLLGTEGEEFASLDKRTCKALGRMFRSRNE